ncbi:MAG: hypothetical protein ABEJ42_04415 [Halobacteriaceae archaeon]
MQRRALLAALGATTASAAGCLGRASPGDGSPTTAPPDTGGPGDPPEDESDPETPPESAGDDGPWSLSVTETTCVSGDGRASIAVAGDAVTVTGAIRAPTPCHGARLADVTRADGTVTLRVETTAPPAGSVCVQCVGAVAYEVTGTPASDVERVVVAHGPAGDARVVAEQER